jgi:hypothetical protein
MATNDDNVKSDTKYVSQPAKVQWAEVEFLADVFGNSILEKSPIVTLVNGSTDYLDLVDDSLFIDHGGNQISVIKGMDKFHREYVSMKVLVESRCDEESEYKLYERAIYTVFRRYTDENMWVMCVSHYTPGKHIFHQLIGACTAIGAGAKNKLEDFSRCADQNKWWTPGHDETGLICSESVSMMFRCKFYK